MSENPHNIPTERIAWLKTASGWENPLKVILGPSDKWQCSKTGRRFVMIAELHTPEKCTYHCHPDNFKPMVDFAKRIALGMETV